MKTMIEVDIPTGRSVAEAQGAVMRAFDPDWMAEWWHIDDVIEQSNDWDADEPNELTNEEAREILRLMSKYHDCEVGINWDVIDNWIDHIKAQRKEVA